MNRLQVERVVPCDCADHALVRLGMDAGIGTLECKVDAASAQAIAAELHGLPGAPAGYVDTMAVALEAVGATVVGVLVTEDGSAPPRANLCVQGYRDIRVRVPLAAALVMATRLDLPVWHRQGPPPAASTVPDVFRDAFNDASVRQDDA